MLHTSIAPEPDYLIPEWPAPAHVRSLCTTRVGGASAGPYASLNLGTHVGDVPEAVEFNRARLGRSLGAKPVFLNQVHGTHMLALGLIAKTARRRMGRLRASAHWPAQ